MTKRKTRLYECEDRCIAAYSLSGAKRLACECDLPGSKVEAMSGTVPYCDSDGEPIGEVSAEDCSSVWPKPLVIPDLG